MARNYSPRKSAAEAMLSQMGGAMPMEDEEMAPPESPEVEAPLPEEGEMAPPASEQGIDLESALAGVEAALSGLSEDVAQEVRTHLEAIRDIASREPGMAESANETDIREELPPAPESTQPPEAPDGGMEKLPL